MSKQRLDAQQMQHLKELGIDISKASSKVYKISETEEYCGYSRDITIIDGYIDNYIDKNDFFTLQDILDLLPRELDTDAERYILDIWYGIYIEKWCVGYTYGERMYDDDCFTGDNLIDASYEMLCWCIMNGYIKTKKKE